MPVERRQHKFAIMLSTQLLLHPIRRVETELINYFSFFSLLIIIVIIQRRIIVSGWLLRLLYSKSHGLYDANKKKNLSFTSRSLVHYFVSSPLDTSLPSHHCQETIWNFSETLRRRKYLRVYCRRFNNEQNCKFSSTRTNFVLQAFIFRANFSIIKLIEKSTLSVASVRFFTILQLLSELWTFLNCFT